MVAAAPRWGSLGRAPEGGPAGHTLRDAGAAGPAPPLIPYAVSPLLRALRQLVGLSPLLHAVPLFFYLLLRDAVAAVSPGGPLGRVADLVALLNSFTPWLFLPIPLWIATLAFARTRTALFATVLPWALFLALYGELFVPRPAHFAEWFGPQPPQASRLRVMTFNVLGSQRPADELVRVILDADADVVMTQELIPGLAQPLSLALASTYPYSRLRTDGLWEAQGIWSRYPIVDEERWDGSQRGANWQHAVLNLDGRPVHLVNLHLTTPRIDVRRGDILPVAVPVGETASARRREVAALVPRLRALSAGGDPVVVAGDLNLTDQTPEFRRLLDAGYANAYRQAGWGIDLTYPAVVRARIVFFPLIGIDHVLVSPAVRARTATVWPEGGSSDHRPVVVDLVLRPDD
jgi:vancomycin resistance protein VanJ